MFYKLNASSQQRARRRGGSAAAPARATFSIAFPESLDLLGTEDRLRRVTIEIASGHGDPGAHRQDLVAVFRELGADDEAADFVAASFLDMPSLASSLGIRLS
jgi:D-serine deaminase-like pyridoxal phosphate-dependent protein